MNQNDQLEWIITKLKWDQKKHEYRYHSCDRVSAVSALYQKRTGKPIDLNHPITYNEKLQWLKCFWYNPFATQCADKLSLRKYLAELGLHEYILPLIGAWEHSINIDFQMLPKKYILKTNHASGFNVFVEDNETFDRLKAVRVFDAVLKSCPFHLNFEWVYEGITPTVIAEPILSGQTEWPLDYKFYCFEGKAKYVHALTAINRTDLSIEPQAALLTDSYEILKESIGYETMRNIPPKPHFFHDMKRIAELISAPFPHVRVDFLASSDKFYVGEMTFFPGSGCDQFSNEELNIKMGQLIKLENIPRKHLRHQIKGIT